MRELTPWLSVLGGLVDRRIGTGLIDATGTTDDLPALGTCSRIATGDHE
jgi:hypothetical protein